MTSSDMKTKDLTLSSKWSITLHDPSSPHVPCITLGQFNTIYGFWKIYNLIIKKNIIQTLPTCINITIYRENTQTKPNSINQWHGEWSVELHHQINPIKIYQKIVLLVIGEQLTKKIRGLVLHRVPVDNGKLNFSISIFTDQKDPEIDVKNILLSNDVIDLDYCITKKAKFRPFRIIHIPMESSSNSEQKEPEETDDNYVTYSMESLLQCSQLMETLVVSQASTHHNERMLQNFKYSDSVLQLFGEHANAYNLSVINNQTMVSEKLQQILFAEGCVVCMNTSLESPYHKEDTNTEQKSDDDEANNSFVIAQCPYLGCQHIIHCKCILNAGDNIIMRENHCSDFFKTIDLSTLSNVEIQKEIGYHINTSNQTGKTYQFSFKLNHLISNKNTVSPQWPVTIPSYFKDKEECLQIFFDRTELQIYRGTIQIAIIAEQTEDHKKKKKEKEKENGKGLMKEEQKGNESEDDPGPAFMHRANFEIPTPSKDNIDNVTNKIYQLKYIDESTRNILLINVNMKFKPNYAVELLSLRYEFAANVTPVSKTDKVSLASFCEHSDSVSASGTSCISGTVSNMDLIGSIITLNDNTPQTEHSEQELHPFTLCPSPPVPPQLSTTPSYYYSPSLHGTMYTSSSPIPTAALSSAPLSMPLSVPLSVPLSIPLPLNTGNLYQNVGIGAINHNHNSININTINNNIIMLQQQQQQQAVAPTNSSLISSNLYLFENIATKFNNPSQLYQYACSPMGSHYIATKIRYPAYFAMFFDKLKTCFPSLMVNCHGHTVCRAIYSQPHCTLSNKIVLLESLLSSFSKIASNRQGSFALICIMSLMTTNAESDIISKAFVSITENGSQFDDVILSQSGYHVIKKFIGFGYPHFNCILNGISSDFTKYATHHYGVPIIRSILDTISTNDHLIKEYSHCLQLFAQHTHSLVCDQYGNYVIQQLLEISPSFVTDTIKEFMVTKYSEYSKHKFASNVVEKCLKHTSMESSAKIDENNEAKEAEESVERRNWSQVIIRELLYDSKSLINHKYGNYCLQTALSVCIDTKAYINNGEKLLKEFIETTRPLLHLLRLNVRKKWQQLLLSATDNEFEKNMFIDSFNSHNYYENY